VDKENNIGVNVNLKLRLEKEKIKEELEQVKTQRDIALRKLNKALEIVKQLNNLIKS
jgi:LPS O-antigen subunit length determinant protein (WzzB/FepE family)